MLLITGLRITGGALFLGAGFGALDTEEEDFDAPDVAEELLDPPAFCCDIAFFSGSDRRTSAAFRLVSEEERLAAAAAALRCESLLLPSPKSSTPVTGSLASEFPFSAIKGMSTSVSDFSISDRLDLQ